MRRFILFVLVISAAVMPLLAQAQKDSLASLIEAGNRKAALDKIRAGADVNEAQPDGTRPVHWAVYHVDHELLQALIAKKAKVDVTNEFGSSPLAEAVKLADATMVKMLLDAGSGVESPSLDGETALMLAIKTGEVPIVEMLIQAGANVNTVEKFHNQTPLMWAAAATKNAGEMVKLLLAKGADVRPRALYSDWPSQITSEPRAQYRPVGGLTALLYAARGGCAQCVEELLAAGADINMPSPEGVTPLIDALDNDHNETAKVLLDHGANPSLWDWWGRTALYVAVDRKNGGSSGGIGTAGRPAGRGGRGDGVSFRGDGPTVSNMEIINMLLAAGVDPSPELNQHRPSRGGNSGRFIDPLLNTGCTPLMRATMGGDIEVMKILLAKGASPNINDMGMTPFLVAAGVGTGGRGTGLAAAASAGGQANVPLMDLLLQNGADVNAQITGSTTYSMRIARSPSANEGMTALHSAAQQGRADMVRYLLDKGARADIVDANGKKPIDLVATAAPRGGGGPPAAAGARGAAPGGGRAGPVASAATLAEIRTMLQNAADK